MKIGIFSDIHGNLPAFKNIYRELKAESCDLYLFLGDICGYYYHQKEIIDLLSELPNLAAIAGNHDTWFLKSLDDPFLFQLYNDRFGRSFQLLRDNIGAHHLDFLKRLPLEFQLQEYKIAAFHGSPWNPLEEYIYPDTPTYKFESTPYEVLFLGHTHYSMDIQHKRVRIINPGSAGQPRDGNWPSYAIYDTDKKQHKIRKIAYNIEELVQEIHRLEEKNEYLITVLYRNKKIKK